MCDDAVSPSIEWRFAPPEATSFIVMMEDASSVQFAADHGNVHWLIIDIPRSNLYLGALAFCTLHFLEFFFSVRLKRQRHGDATLVY